MSLVKRPPASLQSDMDMDDALDRRYNYDNDEDIDPELRLRTVRTAHSAIAESIVADTRQTRRRRRFWGARSEKTRHGHHPEEADPVKAKQEGRGRPEGKRRNVYVNTPLPRGELDSSGDPLVRYPRNKVRTTSELCCSSLAEYYC
jgi:phospholipid-translocating ATPase